MCLHGGGGGGSSAPYKPTQHYTYQGRDIEGDPGIPQEYIDRGIFDTLGWQMTAQKDESDRQMAQQKQIADEQLAFNQKQLQAQQDQQAALQKQADEQAARQTTYDTGRASLLSEGTAKINDAFSRFSPDYFNQYTSDYLTKATDDINYQKGLASKALLFGLARQGLGASQAAVDQQGLIEEKAGMATAQQTQAAKDAAAQLTGQVAQSKNNLLNQVQAAESLAPPIAGVNDQSVNAALDTSRAAISGVANNAGDTIASINGVPTVSPLVNIFSGVMGNVGSFLSGNNAQTSNLAYNSALARASGPGGTNPGQTSTKVT
jgi:hypothetical protein